MTPEDYAARMAAAGFSEREVARGFYFVQRYGVDSLAGPGHVSFDKPSCGNWNCLNPEHQRVSK